MGEYLECDQKMIRKVLTSQLSDTYPNQRRRLGELLLEEGAITKESLEAAISSQRLDRLQQSPFFSGISYHDLEKILDFVLEESVPAGIEFITQDTLGDCFYVFVEGRALVYRKIDFDEEVPLAYIESGECIGEMGYFANGRRSASIRALEGSHLLKIKYDDLEKIFQTAPILATKFLEMVADRLRRTNLMSTSDELFKIADKAVNTVVGYDLKPYPFSGWNDTVLLREIGIPTIVLGPADIPAYQGHGPDEWVSIDRLVDFAKIYGLMAMDVCGFFNNKQ